MVGIAGVSAQPQLIGTVECGDTVSGDTADGNGTSVLGFSSNEVSLPLRFDGNQSVSLGVPLDSDLLLRLRGICACVCYVTLANEFACLPVLAAHVWI